MKAIITVNTPKGQAEEAIKMLRRFLDIRKLKNTWTTNKDKSKVLIKTEGSVIYINKLVKRVAMFDQLLTGVLSHKFTQKALKKALNKEDMKQLETMLSEHTSINVVTSPSNENT